MSSGKLNFQKNVNIRNKKASYEYQFIDKYVAGIVLQGSEIKSIRLGKVNLQDSYCTFFNNELLNDLIITTYNKLIYNAL